MQRRVSLGTRISGEGVRGPSLEPLAEEELLLPVLSENSDVSVLDLSGASAAASAFPAAAAGSLLRSGVGDASLLSLLALVRSFFSFAAFSCFFSFLSPACSSMRALRCPFSLRSLCECRCSRGEATLASVGLDDD